jgi:hypothetical protein
LIPGRLLKRNGADEALNQPLGRKTRGDGEVLDSRQKMRCDREKPKEATSFRRWKHRRNAANLVSG